MSSLTLFGHDRTRPEMGCRRPSLMPMVRIKRRAVANCCSDALSAPTASSDGRLRLAHLTSARTGRGEEGMDLNYLFHRQQVERTRAAAAASNEARVAHEQLARCYETRINQATDGRLYADERCPPAAIASTTDDGRKNDRVSAQPRDPSSIRRHLDPIDIGTPAPPPNQDSRGQGTASGGRRLRQSA